MNAPAREIEAALGLDRPRRRGWRRAAIALLVVAASAAALWRLSVSGEPEAAAYATETLARGALTVTVIATGTVEPTNLVEISSELSGAVREVLVDRNDTVRVGQPLARLDTAKLEAQIAHSRAGLAARLARVAEAEATLSEARDQHDRVVSLAERAVSTVQAREQAVASLRRAEAMLAVAQADVEVARADLRLDETNLAKACICSPIDGTVLDRNVDAGQIVASSFQAPVLFTIAEDLRQMELRVDVDEADMGRVAVGQPARFTVEAFPGRSFPAAIAELRYAPKTVDGVVTYEAVLTIDNADLSLRPGMTATAEITVAEVSDALLVPNAALRFAPPAETTAPSKGGAGLLGLIMPRRPGAQAPASALASDPEGWRTLWRLKDGAAEPVRVRAGASDGLRTEILEGPLAAGRRRGSRRRPAVRDAAPPDPPLIALGGLSRHYGQGDALVRALDGIDLEIAQGEFVAIMGPSGSGKSTCMNIIGCLDAPTAGSYRFGGVEVSRLTLDQRALLRRRFIGFVFQGYNLLPRTSAVENVELPLAYMGVGRAERRARALDALDKVGLLPRAGHAPSELSGGQQQRVAIARAIVGSPALIVADEPTGNLDSARSREIMALLLRFNREEGVTVVMVTHEPEMAAWAGRQVRFADGRIVADERKAEAA